MEGTPVGTIAMAWLDSQLGLAEEALPRFERLAAVDFADVPRDGGWLTSMAYLSETCASLADGRRAAALYDLLIPYADRNVVQGAFSDYWGSSSRYLGLLAATMERWEDAARHFQDAIEMNARMGARPWLAHTQHDYAGMLLRRGAKGDRKKALALLTQALDTAQELGMTGLVEKALALKLKAQGVDLTSPQASIDAVAASVYADKPDLRAHAAPDGTVTIMFSDIEGSTALAERLGDRRFIELLREHN